MPLTLSACFWMKSRRGSPSRPSASGTSGPPSGRLGRVVLSQLRNDVLNPAGLIGVKSDQLVEQGLCLSDLPGAPEAGGGTQTAAQGQVGGPGLGVILRQ